MKKSHNLKFLIVGAAKSGTTSLFNYLNQHPNIYIPDVKECRFFSNLPKNFKGLGAEFFVNSGITDEKEYFGLFKGNEDKVCGDISNDYLYYYEKSVENIKKYLGNEVEIVIILRNPIDRAYSNYMHHIRDGWEDVSFEQALDDEEKRIADNWGWSYHYVKTGMYFNQVRAYLDNFKNVKIYLFEELKEKDILLEDLYKYLGVEFQEELKIDKEYNVSGYPKSKFVHNFFNKDSTFKSFLKSTVKMLLPNEIIRKIVSNIKNKNLEKLPMKKKTKEKLKEVFRDDINKLSELISRDLSHWLK